MLFLIASDYNKLDAANPHVTVEAEYGDTVVKGSLLTLAHHGSRSHNPAPCTLDNLDLDPDTIVGLSHVDLDTIGGCAAVLGFKTGSDSFWALAEFIDLNGAHKLGESGASAEDIRALRAYWAFSDSNKVWAPKDGSVEDVTDSILEHVSTVNAILAGNTELLDAGDAFHKMMEALPTTSLLFSDYGVIFRKSSRFVNHLYEIDGKKQKAVVAFNTSEESVTLSFSDEGIGNACKIVQSLWGPDAGGHVGIAGSPRDRKMTMEDASDCYNAVCEDIRESEALKLAKTGGLWKG